MLSRIALIGGEEFSDGFEDVHAQLMELVRSTLGINQRPVRVVYLPLNAAQDGMEAVQYWCDQAQQRLGGLGLAVLTPMVVDTDSANDPSYAEAVAQSDWVYLGGGYPHVGMGILTGSRVEAALYRARQRGALIAGASAGAMMLCQTSWVITAEMDEVITKAIMTSGGVEGIDLPPLGFLKCLGLVPGVMCLPHLNQFFPQRWLNNGMLPAGMRLIGIDEQTAIVKKDGQSWEVLGNGRVVILEPDFSLEEFHAGEWVSLGS